MAETAVKADFDSIEEVMFRQRAVRIFSDEPVEDALIERAINAATHAPSGGNTQPNRFIVIRNQDTKRKLGVIFDELGKQLYGDNAPERTPWENVPVLIAICTESGRPADGSSVFPVVQNLLFALHAMGLGSVLTNRWKRRETEVKPLLGLPDNWEAHAILPVGWPGRKYGRGKRRPAAEITFREQYGTSW